MSEIAGSETELEAPNDGVSVNSNIDVVDNSSVEKKEHANVGSHEDTDGESAELDFHDSTDAIMGEDLNASISEQQAKESELNKEIEEMFGGHDLSNDDIIQKVDSAVQQSDITPPQIVVDEVEDKEDVETSVNEHIDDVAEKMNDVSINEPVLESEKIEQDEPTETEELFTTPEIEESQPGKDEVVEEKTAQDITVNDAVSDKGTDAAEEDLNTEMPQNTVEDSEHKSDETDTELNRQYTAETEKKFDNVGDSFEEEDLDTIPLNDNEPKTIVGEPEESDVNKEEMTAPPPLPLRSIRKKPVHKVPPTLESEMQTRTFRKSLIMIQSDHELPSPPKRPRSVSKPIDSAAEIDMIADRFRKTSNNFRNENETTKENIQKGKEYLKSSYTNLVATLRSTSKGTNDTIDEEETTNDINNEDDEQHRKDIVELGLVNVDWDFWSQVVNDFEKITSEETQKLEAKITDGIPQQIRGIIWQLISNSKSEEYDKLYEELLPKESPHEGAIRRDLKRTNFIPEEKTESLFNVIKAFSIYDSEVGYTQGMAFIVAPLLINCKNESDAFSLLLNLMNNYGLRDFYLPGMPGLMLMLYQFDRLLEESSPQLYNYLARQGVRSTMYATQWFLTFFAYKFPLAFVLRIFDIVFVEGIEAILKFAVILLLKNENKIMTLKFDQLLEFLKNELFFYYSQYAIDHRRTNKNHVEHDDGEHDISDNESVIRNELIKVETTESAKIAKKVIAQGIHDSDYDINMFVHDAISEVHITPITLQRFVAEYDEIHQIEQQKEQQYEHMRIKNRQLQNEVKKLEHDYTLLNREHVNIANELIRNRLKIETLNDEKNDVYQSLLETKKLLQEERRKQELPNPDASLPSDLKFDLEQAMERNSQVMIENMKLQDKITELENELQQLQSQPTKETESPSPPATETKPATSSGWSGFKKVFTKP